MISSPRRKKFLHRTILFSDLSYVLSSAGLTCPRSKCVHDTSPLESTTSLCPQPPSSLFHSHESPVPVPWAGPNLCYCIYRYHSWGKMFFFSAPAAFIVILFSVFHSLVAAEDSIVCTIGTSGNASGPDAGSTAGFILDQPSAIPPRTASLVPLTQPLTQLNQGQQSVSIGLLFSLIIA